MTDLLRPTDADQLAALARAGRPLAATAVRLTAGGPADQHAERLVEHWRREAVLLTGLTGLGGRLAAAAQDAVSTAVQASLVLCLCEVEGVHDLRTRVQVVAAAVLDSRVPASWQPTGHEGEPAAGDDAGARAALLALGRRVWAVRRVTSGRREGRLWHRGLSRLPVVGAPALLLGERHALEGVAARATAELAALRR